MLVVYQTKFEKLYCKSCDAFYRPGQAVKDSLGKPHCPECKKFISPKIIEDDE